MPETDPATAVDPAAGIPEPRTAEAESVAESSAGAGVGVETASLVGAEVGARVETESGPRAESGAAPRTVSAVLPRRRAARELFEPYALAVEMADRVSERRGGANKFFLSVQTSLLAAVGLADTTLDHIAWYSALAGALTGCAISAVWWLQLRSYRMLNSAKFTVINKLEEQLPTQVFTDEWKILKRVPDRGARGLAYVELGTTERLVPWFLAALHLLLLLGRLLG